jgi:hypothetical protein
MEYLEDTPAISTYLVINGKDNGDPEFYLEGLVSNNYCYRVFCSRYDLY